MIDNLRGVVAMSGGTIFGIYPFVPKRVIILPFKGGEITLYVLEGVAYPTTFQEIGSLPRKVIQSVHFDGWSPSFKNTKLNISPEYLIPGENEYYELDVVFRLIPSDEAGQTAEIVALSFDECITFHVNELSTLAVEYEAV